MPSAHSQFIWFFSTYLILWICFYKPHFSPFYNPRHYTTNTTNTNTPNTNSNSSSDSKINLQKSITKSNYKSLNKTFTIISLLLLALAVSFSRVYLFYHTDIQVLVGSSVGILAAFVWIFVVFTLRKTGIVDWVLDWPIIKWFYIKDTSLSSHSFIKDEYKKWRKDRKRGKLLVKAE